MRKLIYIGSPHFDGIGLLNIEAQKIQRDGELTILDGIVPGYYFEIQNIHFLSHFIWKWLRKAQFLSTLVTEKTRYLKISDLVRNAPCESHEIVGEILEEATVDLCVNNNFSEKKALDYHQLHWSRHYSFLCRAYAALVALFQQEKFSQIIIFNGRSSIARLLIAVAKEQSIPVRWLEYFGSRENRMTYISSPVNIFDYDAMSNSFLEAYRNCQDPDKELAANEYLKDRVNRGDPFLQQWGVDLSKSPSVGAKGEKMVAAFFFSSEDEYPALKPSIYGLKPPNEQYNAFSRICDRIIGDGLQERYRFLVKLHPRYIAEKAKLCHAHSQWDRALSRARQHGLNFELVDPLASAYKVIAEVDLVLSYGTTAWEATYLGKPAVLMGPHFFSTHDCVYIANSVEDVISYLKNPPHPKPIVNCYPYAWALRELGHSVQEFNQEARGRLPWLMANTLKNRFYSISKVKPRTFSR